MNNYWKLVSDDDADTESPTKGGMGEGGGWFVFVEPVEYDGTNDDVLTPFVIKYQCPSVFISLRWKLSHHRRL